MNYIPTLVLLGEKETGNTKSISELLDNADDLVANSNRELTPSPFTQVQCTDDKAMFLQYQARQEDMIYANFERIHKLLTAWLHPWNVKEILIRPINISLGSEPMNSIKTNTPWDELCEGINNQIKLTQEDESKPKLAKIKEDLNRALTKMGETPTTEDNDITMQTEDMDLKKCYPHTSKQRLKQHSSRGTLTR